MTNTETPAYVSNFDKAAALVAVERVGFYTGDVTDAIWAGVKEGFLSEWISGDGVTALRLTDAGRERLAGFRALLAPAE